MFPPFVDITSYRVRAYLAPRIASLCFVMLCLHYIYCYSPLFSPVGYETDVAAALIDYSVDDPFLPEQPGKPPLITRYRLFLLSIACIRVV